MSKTAPAANAIYAKAHSKYGRRLTPENYRDLLACQSVPDIASFLKSHTRYAEALTDTKDGNVHRGHLESLLRRYLFRESERLCSFEHSVGEPFYEYLILQGEIAQILTFIRYYDAGKPEEFIFAMQPYIEEHGRVDLTLLSGARSLADALRALEHTPFYAVLSPLVCEKNISYTDIEHALYTYLYRRAHVLAARDPGAAAEITALMDAYIELDNVSRIYRMKEYFHASADKIRPYLFECAGRIKANDIEQMLAASSGAEVFRVFKATPYRREIEKSDSDSLPDCITRIRYNLFRHSFRFSNHPTVAIYTYIHLAKAEVDNIVTIIEGVRYGVSADEIKPLLIGVN